MKIKQLLTKTLLAAVCLLAGQSVWAVDVPTPVYFNNFTSSTDLTVIGSGSFVVDNNPRFGKIYYNDPNQTKSVRTNYLKLPSDVLQHSATSKEMTIGFWVNKKNAETNLYYPLFSAYSQAPRTDNLSNYNTTSNENGMPMFVCQSRGLLQYNNESEGGTGSWCNFEAAQNDATSNTESNSWLDDNNWHYYTVTLTETKAIVYVDGNIVNSWTLDNTSDGQKMTGFFTNTTLSYVTLGGNQAWGWGDPDPAFGFDDFAVYDAALSAEQIAQIMTDKTTTSDITSLSANYTFNASSNINPFDNGAIWHGTYVDAFLPSMSSGTRALTATAYFDSDTETDGKQAFNIASGDAVTISMLMYNGYNSAQDNNQTTYSVYNSDGTSLVSFTYNSKSCNFSDVSFGGTTVEGFEAFSGQSSFNGTQGANGISDGSKPFVATSGYNPVVTISIAGDGKVSINFVRTKNTAYDKTFSATLSDVKMDLAKVVIASSNYGKGGTNNGDRISGIGYMNFALTHTVTVKAVDGDNKELSTISTHSVNDGATLNYAYPRYVLDGTTVYKKDKQSNNEYRITSGAITSTQDVNVVYSQYATDGYFYTEAEDLGEVTKGTTSGAYTRTSMSALAYGTDIAVTTLPAGVYKATIGWYGKSGETCTIKAGDVAVVSATQNGSWGETLGGWFTLTEPTAVTMTATGNNYTGIDYILIEKISNVSATITAAGWATLYTPYALDFSGVEGLKAYTATTDGVSVTLTPVSDVPANTGVVLEGSAGNYSIPVIASSGTDKGGLQGSATEATTCPAETGFTYYILTLAQNGVDVQFNPATSGSIAEGKAFLKVANPVAAKALSVMFANDPTGIANVNAAEVAQPAKRIVNGQLVIEKNGKRYNAAGAEF